MRIPVYLACPNCKDTIWKLGGYRVAFLSHLNTRSNLEFIRHFYTNTVFESVELRIEHNTKGYIDKNGDTGFSVPSDSIQQ